MNNYTIWANSVVSHNSKMLGEGKLQNRRFQEYFVLWLMNLAENLVDDSPSWSLLALQRILKSAKNGHIMAVFRLNMASLIQQSLIW